MLRIRSRIATFRPDEHTLVLRLNPGRRIVFGLVGAVLVIAFAVSVDWGGDFSRDGIIGTIFYLFVTVVCIGVAVWGRSVIIDRSAGQISFRSSLAGMEMNRVSVASANVRAVTLQGVQLLKDSERPQPGLLNNRFRGYVERRTQYYKLNLDLGDRLHFVDDSTDLSDLDTVANEMATFLDVALERQEM